MALVELVLVSPDDNYNYTASLGFIAPSVDALYGGLREYKPTSLTATLEGVDGQGTYIVTLYVYLPLSVGANVTGINGVATIPDGRYKLSFTASAWDLGPLPTSGNLPKFSINGKALFTGRPFPTMYDVGWPPQLWIDTNTGIIPPTVVPDTSTDTACYQGYVVETPTGYAYNDINGNFVVDGLSVGYYDRNGNPITPPSGATTGISVGGSSSLGPLPLSYLLVGNPIGSYDIKTNKAYLVAFPKCVPNFASFDLVAGNGQIMSNLQLSEKDLTQLENDMNGANPMFLNSQIKNLIEDWSTAIPADTLQEVENFLTLNAAPAPNVEITFLAQDNTAMPNVIISLKDLSTIDSIIHSNPSYINAGFTDETPSYLKPNTTISQLQGFLDQHVPASTNVQFTVQGSNGQTQNVVLSSSSFEQLLSTVQSPSFSHAVITNAKLVFNGVNSTLDNVLAFIKGTISTPIVQGAQGATSGGTGISLPTNNKLLLAGGGLAFILALGVALGSRKGGRGG